MTENTAPNTAENQRTVDLRNDDQEDHRADCTMPAVKKLKLAHKQFASPSSSGGRPQGPFWPFFSKSAAVRRATATKIRVHQRQPSLTPHGGNGKSDAKPLAEVHFV
ncbi:TPA: hypothetical protein ACH3X1_000612 [Trebouxia sp. C0004]